MEWGIKDNAQKKPQSPDQSLKAEWGEGVCARVCVCVCVCVCAVAESTECSRTQPYLGCVVCFWHARGCVSWRSSRRTRSRDRSAGAERDREGGRSDRRRG